MGKSVGWNGAVALKLHTHPYLTRDNRPRVKVSYLMNEQRIGFSVILDTGAGRSTLMLANEDDSVFQPSRPSYTTIEESDPVDRPAWWAEGYVDNSRAPRVNSGDGNFVFGLGSATLAVEIQQCVRETARLFSGDFRFDFDLNICLTRRMLNENIGAGSVGAQFDSDFAQAAGVFSIVKCETLLIGYPAVNSPISYMPNSHSTHWVIGGYISFGSNSAMEYLGWVLDTGANCIFVPGNTLRSIQEALVSVGGAEFDVHLPGSYPSYRNCDLDRLRQVLPPISFQLGHLNVLIPVDEYIVPLPGDKKRCGLVVAEIKRHQGHLLPVIGTAVLSKIIVIFDQVNRRVGIALP